MLKYRRTGLEKITKEHDAMFIKNYCPICNKIENNYWQTSRCKKCGQKLRPLK